MDTYLITIASKMIKYLRIKLTKERKDLYNKNFLSEESDLEDIRKGKDFSYSQVFRANSMRMIIPPNAVYRVNVVPIKIP